MSALVGTSGIALIQGVDAIPTNGTPVSEIVKIAIQAIIGLITVFKLLKKPKPTL
jgi:hypothetical protein